MKNSQTAIFSVLIPDGESWLSYSVQSCLARIPGVEISVLSNKAFDPIRFSRYTRHFFSYSADDTMDDHSRLAAICDAAQKAKADIILPVDTETMRLLSVHKSTILPIAALAPLPSAEVIDIASNKWLLAQWLNQHHIPCPTTLLYQDNALFEQALHQLTFPVLIKPIEQDANVGIGGRGIQTFNDRATLLAYCKQDTDVNYIVQPFITGYDIDCSVLCEAGEIKAYTIQKGYLAGASRFAPPAGIEFLHDDKTYDVVQKLVTQMKWTGIAHFDLRYDAKDQQVKVIEINARFWGSLFGSVYAGVNFPYLTCLAGLGHTVPEVDFQSSRYVNGGTAARLMYQRFRSGQKEKSFDFSALDFMLKDPLPKILEGLLSLCKKLMLKLNHGAFSKPLLCVKTRM